MLVQYLFLFAEVNNDTAQFKSDICTHVFCFAENLQVVHEYMINTMALDPHYK